MAVNPPPRGHAYETAAAAATPPRDDWPVVDWTMRNRVEDPPPESDDDIIWRHSDARTVVQREYYATWRVLLDLMGLSNATTTNDPTLVDAVRHQLSLMSSATARSSSTTHHPTNLGHTLVIPAVHEARLVRMMQSHASHCHMEGITCATMAIAADGEEFSVVTSIAWPKSEFTGTLSSHLAHWSFLQSIDLSYNDLHGTIPTELASLRQLKVVHLSGNQLSLSPPQDHAQPLLPRAVAIALDANALAPGSLATLVQQLVGTAVASPLQWLDVSSNLLTGPLPVDTLVRATPHLSAVWASSNLLTGPLPDLTALSLLHTFDVHDNALDGLLDFAHVPAAMRHWIVSSNQLTGPLAPPFPYLSHVHAIVASDNALTGTIPVDHWSKLRQLGVLQLRHNQLTGTIPIAFMTGQAASLGLLDVGYNKLTGTIATEIGLMSALYTIDLMFNALTGTIPNEMMGMNPNLRLNFTNNLLTGTIPALFCGHGASSMNLLYRDFGCDAVLCRPQTFNLHGHATLHSACRPCPTLDADVVTVLGRTHCPGVDHVHGDFDGDGLLHPREILRMIYIDTLGRFWGQAYQTWADVRVNECDLLGITCVNGKVARIDLTGADLCSNGERRPGPIHYCYGLPAEIGLLSTLEVFQLTRRQFLRGPIPTQLGKLSLLRLLDISACTSMTGTLPTELGRLTNLKRLMLSHSRFRGTIPTEILSLGLEKLYLTNNQFTGTISTWIGKLTNVKEFMISRNKMSGSIPRHVGKMTKLENFEAYHNHLVGSIPKEIALPNLKRIDVFGNQLSGSIPEELARLEALQILHLKENQLTGTLSVSFGAIPYLSWLDVSNNKLVGTIPLSLGESASLDDFRASENMLYDDIPRGLCANTKLNSGSAQQHGCNGVLCPVGTYSENGFASGDETCLPCPDGRTSLYLGSTTCLELSMNEMLTMLYEVMHTAFAPHDRSMDGMADHFICDWEGVVCDDSGQANSLMFPLYATVED